MLRNESSIREREQRARRGAGALARTALLAALALAAPLASRAQPAAQGAGPVVEDGMVQLDFTDVELPVVIDTIARLTGKNYIYDDRVRGRVTIVSPTKISISQAEAVFESVLQVKGFTVVPGPGGTQKVIPIREAPTTNIETFRESKNQPQSDRFITRLIPLHYIDAQAIADTLKPLISKDASMVAYPPTNTVILTDSGSNIARILDLLSSIDVETYKEELAVIKVRHADAATLADQLSEIFGADVSEAAAGPGGIRPPPRPRRAVAQPPVGGVSELPSADRVRIITDQRTNSLIVLAARQKLDDIRGVVSKLDVQIDGGRIHVYYLKHADAEELSQTLNALISGQAVPSSSRSGSRSGSLSGRQSSLASAVGSAATGVAGGNPGARTAITELAEGVTITADPPTNSLVIQASPEGFATVKSVIDMLDVERPQVLVEALIMEVDVSDAQDLGFSGLVRVFSGCDKDGKNCQASYGFGTLTDTKLGPFSSDSSSTGTGTGGTTTPGTGVDLGDAKTLLGPLLAGASPASFLTAASIEAGTTLIQYVIRASATVNGTNILSAPNILTSDNEEAEIKVGANIPIITSRVQSAAGIDTATNNNLATSVNVERQDIGVTLRVTPQISEGDAVRLSIFQEITDVNDALSGVTGNPEDVGVSLSSRKVENVVVVSNHETVVIGGLISDNYKDNNNKVPWLGDVPILGWLFKTTGKTLQKTNLLVFLTPHIVRSPSDLEHETIRKREEFWDRSEEGVQLSERESKEAEKRREEAEAAGLPPEEYVGNNPVRGELISHAKRYPLERMREIEESEDATKRQAAEEAEALERHPGYGVLAAVYRNEKAARELLMQLVDAGYDGTIQSSGSGGAVLYEIRIGPYKEQDDARRAATTIGEAFGLSPTVYVERPPADGGRP